ncbi:MAG: hypothetical protein RLO52_37805 [Sandaracinaceae bacterium]
MRALPCALIGALAFTFAAAPALAQTELEQAESAYLEVDFESTRDHALEALREGGHPPEELVRIYQLLGTASSLMGEEDAARDYFVRMLGIDRDAQLDESVPPRARNPYLEARGIWAARQGRLSISTGLDRASSAVRVELRDPTDMARRVRLAARLEGQAEYNQQEYQSQSVLAVPVEGAAEADRVEYYVEIVDMHGNVLLAEGSPFAPRVVGRVPSGGGGAEGEGGGGRVTFFEEPLFWILVGVGVLAAGAVTAAVIVDQRSSVALQTGISFGVD